MVRTNFTREQVASVLNECLRFVAGNKTPDDVRADMIVLREWCLDSEHGVELACDLRAQLGIEIPDKDNPLIEESGPTKKQRDRTFGEVVDYLMNFSQN